MEAEAERYNVLDAKAYVQFLRASIALAAGEIQAARRFVGLARSASTHGSPPPHFKAAIEGLSAHISVFEPSSGPTAGLRGLADALRMAVDAGSAETVTAHLADAAGPRWHSRAVRGRGPVLAASDTWRANVPRPAVEQAQIAETKERIRAELGAQRYQAEHTDGRALTTEEVVSFLTAITAGLTRN
ncbi:hypothetical protein NKH18_27940 [Streptomyces sp. M10(2022)]